MDILSFHSRRFSQKTRQACNYVSRKTRKQIRCNLDNPFRGWDGAEHIPTSAAKKAANQYRKTRSQLMKLAAEPGEDAQAQALEAVAAYTQTFNKMGFIETEERDEIYMALRGILDALPGDALQKDSMIEKFDELRDF